MLYRAGILSGNDGYGTFKPDSELKRCEAAAMFARLAGFSERSTQEPELKKPLYT